MKIMTICTIDVHARDVVAKMILAKVFVTQGYLYCVVSWQFGVKISCCFMRKPHVGSQGCTGAGVRRGWAGSRAKPDGGAALLAPAMCHGSRQPRRSAERHGQRVWGGLGRVVEGSSPAPALLWDLLARSPRVRRRQTVPKRRLWELAVPAGRGGPCRCRPPLRSRLLRRWRAPRSSPGSPSSGTAGTRGGGTATPTSATLSSSTPTSTWGTPPAWSSPP